LRPRHASALKSQFRAVGSSGRYFYFHPSAFNRNFPLGAPQRINKTYLQFIKKILPFARTPSRAAETPKTKNLLEYIKGVGVLLFCVFQDNIVLSKSEALGQ